MRSSVLSRSVIAVASLAIGSAALAASPATAAPSTVLTRGEVLAAAAALRADAVSGRQSETSKALIDALAAKVCGIPVDSVFLSGGTAVTVPDSVDGLTVTVLQPSETPAGGPTTPFGDVDSCTFAAVAPIGGSTTFDGDLDVTTDNLFFPGGIGGPGGIGSSTENTSRYQLSGNVFASPAVKTTHQISFSSLTSEGLVTTPDGKRVLTESKIADTKSKAVKKAAKKTYVKRIKAAKKTYAKAVKRAGGNQTKKAAARMAYVNRRAVLTSAYAYAIADYKLVKTRSTQADARRFSVTSGSIFS